MTRCPEERKIDEAVEESFPASDPPSQSSTPQAGLDGKRKTEADHLKCLEEEKNRKAQQGKNAPQEKS